MSRSSTKIRMTLFGKNRKFDAIKALDKQGVSIVKDIIKNVQPDERESGSSMEQLVEKSMDALAKGDQDAVRRMSEGFELKGKSILKRNETIKLYGCGLESSK